MTTATERVRASEARKIKSGGRRMPSGILSPAAAAALDGLLKAGYATSMTACIERALIETHPKRKGRER